MVDGAGELREIVMVYAPGVGRANTFHVVGGASCDGLVWDLPRLHTKRQPTLSWKK